MPYKGFRNVTPTAKFGDTADSMAVLSNLLNKGVVGNLNKVIAGRRANIDLAHEQETEANDIAIRSGLENLRNLAAYKNAEEQGKFSVSGLSSKYGKRYNQATADTLKKGILARLRREAVGVAQEVGRKAAISGLDELEGAAAMEQSLLDQGMAKSEIPSSVNTWLKNNQYTDNAITSGRGKLTRNYITDTLGGVSPESNENIEILMAEARKANPHMNYKDIRSYLENKLTGTQADYTANRKQEMDTRTDTQYQDTQDLAKANAAYTRHLQKGGDPKDHSQFTIGLSDKSLNAFNQNRLNLVNQTLGLNDRQKEDLEFNKQMTALANEGASAQEQFQISEAQAKLSALKEQTFTTADLGNTFGKNVIASIDTDPENGNFKNILSVIKQNDSRFKNFPEKKLKTLHQDLVKKYGGIKASLYIAKAYEDTAYLEDDWWGQGTPITAMTDMVHSYAAKDQAVVEQSNAVSNLMNQTRLNTLSRKQGALTKNRKAKQTLRQGGKLPDISSDGATPNPGNNQNTPDPTGTQLDQFEQDFGIVPGPSKTKKPSTFNMLADAQAKAREQATTIKEEPSLGEQALRELVKNAPKKQTSVEKTIDPRLQGFFKTGQNLRGVAKDLKKQFTKASTANNQGMYKGKLSFSDLSPALIRNMVRLLKHSHPELSQEDLETLARTTLQNSKR